MLKHLKLQHAYHAHDHFLHAGEGFVEDLDGTLLCDLGGALHKLLTLHGILVADPGEMLRRKGGDALKFKAFARRAHRVPDGENARVEHTDDISGVCLVDDFPLLRHDLLGLGQTHFLVALHMEHFHVPLKLAGADS